MGREALKFGSSSAIMIKQQFEIIQEVWLLKKYFKAQNIDLSPLISLFRNDDTEHAKILCWLKMIINT